MLRDHLWTTGVPKTMSDAETKHPGEKSELGNGGGSVLSNMELFQKIVGVVQKQIPIVFEILKGFMFNVVRGCWMPLVAFESFVGR